MIRPSKKGVVLTKLKAFELVGRVQRLFGTYIPPKKVPKARKYITLRFKLTGVIPSKKNDYYSENNYRMIMDKAFASPDPKQYLYDNLKSWIRGSKRYLEWLDEIDADISAQREFWRLKYAKNDEPLYPLELVSIKMCHYFADDFIRDCPNKDESIYDMLVLKGIIADDNYGVVYRYGGEGACYTGEIPDTITTIDVTAAYY